MTKRSSAPHHRLHARTRRAFSLVEAALASVIIGGLTVATLNVVGAAAVSRAMTARALTAEVLARDLLSEILAKRYQEDPANDVPFGPDGAEASATDRTLFDDVDDYHGLSENPPRNRDGTATGYSGTQGMVREVRVEYLDPSVASFNATTAVNNGLLRITVLIKSGQKTLASVVGIKSAASDGAPK
jgi:hypothetical protein